MNSQTPALAALEAGDLEAHVVRYAPAGNAPEAAARRGVPLGALVKTLVVRRGAGDYVLVLVPGDRTIDWPKLRSHLGVSRVSMPDADEAKAATGYERGTITPFGCEGDWPVIADTTVAELPVASIGGGGHGIAINLAGVDLVDYLQATVADITTPLAPPGA